jgi:valyl-tRNA synthetase
MKGNGIDPLDIIDRYGADALRFTMAFIATETQDNKLPVANVCPHCDHLVSVRQEHMYMRTKKLTCSECKKAFRPGGPWPEADPDLPTARQASERFDMGRHFANKLWNAARLVLTNLEGYTPGALRLEELPLEDRWILSRLATTVGDVTRQLEEYHFSEAVRTIYDFTWSEFCDWYVEMSKGRLRDETTRPLAQRVLAGTLDGIVRLVQPFMPFVAESIWQELNERAFERGLPTPEPSSESVCIAAWPDYPAPWRDEAMETRLRRMQDLVGKVREVRTRALPRDPRTPLNISIRCSPLVADDFRTLSGFIKQLANVGTIDCGPDVLKPKQSATQVHGDFELYVSLAGLIDLPAETARIEKQVAEKEKALAGAKAKLANEGFIARAKPEVVQQVRDQVADLEAQLVVLAQTLRDLAQG